jgi:hypothetical protein
MAKQRKKTEGFFKLVNHRSSIGLGDLKSAHEACMQCIQLALSEKRDASVYYVLLDTDKIISEELIFSYNIERIKQLEDEM